MCFLKITVAFSHSPAHTKRHRNVGIIRYEQQRMEYELRFMSERERRRTLREQEKANDKRLQRQLKFIARK